MYRLAGICLALLTPLVPLVAIENAGIVDGIWLSDPTPVENQSVRIYAAIHNTTDGDLEGTVHFRVNDQLLDTMRINALSGRIVESWADWVPEAGTSTLTVQLRRTELASTASGTQSVEVVQPLIEETVFIAIDTDGDTIADSEDEDDDNDGVDDETERERGTDPLVYDEPPAPEPNDATSTQSSAENTTETPDPNSVTRNGDSPAGLEAVVGPGTSQNLLARTTNAISETKERLDTYRSNRQQASAKTTTESETQTTTSGSEQSSSTEKDGPGIGTTIMNVLNWFYSGVLTVVSWFLGYPGLVQLLLLLLLLYGLYRLARHFGQRPTD
jgi:hypothetical protein